MRWKSHDAKRTVPSPPSCELRVRVLSFGGTRGALTVTTKSKRWGERLHMSAVQYRSWPSGSSADESRELVMEAREELLDDLRRGTGTKSSG